MTYERRLKRRQERKEMARKLDKLPGKTPKKRPDGFSFAVPTEMLEAKEAYERYAADERKFMAAMKEVSRGIDSRVPDYKTFPPEMTGLRTIVEGGSISKVPDADRVYWTDPSMWRASRRETHSYRYPVSTGPRRMSVHHTDGGTLPPPESCSFTEQELRYKDGDSTVEVWEGVKMVARIPVTALQSVLMNELLEAVDPKDEEDLPW